MLPIEVILLPINRQVKPNLDIKITLQLNNFNNFNLKALICFLKIK